MSAMTGQCLCGAVRLTAEKVETEHHACHCGMCRRWTGGPQMAALAEGVSLEGEDNIAIYASSEWAERAFCKKCGSNLFYRLKANGLMILNVGLFDDRDAFELVGEIFIDHKPQGYAFAGEHRRLTEKETLEKFGSG